jgi:hypothetical protein
MTVNVHTEIGRYTIENVLKTHVDGDMYCVVTIDETHRFNIRRVTRAIESK